MSEHKGSPILTHVPSKLTRVALFVSTIQRLNS